MTEAERSMGMEVLKAIEAGIQEVEKRVNIKILAHSYMIIDEKKAKVSYALSVKLLLICFRYLRKSILNGSLRKRHQIIPMI